MPKKKNRRMLSDDEKRAMLKLRQQMPEEDRKGLDNIACMLYEAGYDIDKVVYAPYVIYALGMKFASDTGIRVIESDEIKSHLYIVRKDGN